MKDENCVVCRQPIPQPQRCYVAYLDRYVHSSGQCSQLLDDLDRDYSHSKRGRWRSKRAILDLIDEHASDCPLCRNPDTDHAKHWYVHADITTACGRPVRSYPHIVRGKEFWHDHPECTTAVFRVTCPECRAALEQHPQLQQQKRVSHPARDFVLPEYAERFERSMSDDASDDAEDD
jgi:hypothetical protein